MFLLPRETPGFSYHPIEMDIVETERQCQLFIDDVRLPAEALVGGHDAPLEALFAGLNPERIMGAATAAGTGRFAINKARRYLQERNVWGVPIGAHQGLAHPLAQCHIEVELSRLMLAKAATCTTKATTRRPAKPPTWPRTRPRRPDRRPGPGRPMPRRQRLAADTGSPCFSARRASPRSTVSREMILNFVAQLRSAFPSGTSAGGICPGSCTACPATAS